MPNIKHGSITVLRTENQKIFRSMTIQGPFLQKIFKISNMLLQIKHVYHILRYEKSALFTE